MKKQEIVGGIFLIVPLMFVLSLVTPDIWSIILLPVGAVAAVVVFLIDIFSKKLFKKGQVVKLLFDSLLTIKLGLLFECFIITVIASGVAFCCAFFLIIFLSLSFDDISEKAQEMDNQQS